MKYKIGDTVHVYYGDDGGTVDYIGEIVELMGDDSDFGMFVSHDGGVSGVSVEDIIED